MKIRYTLKIWFSDTETTETWIDYDSLAADNNAIIEARYRLQGYAYGLVGYQLKRDNEIIWEA